MINSPRAIGSLNMKFALSLILLVGLALPSMLDGHPIAGVYNNMA